MGASLSADINIDVPLPLASDINRRRAPGDLFRARARCEELPLGSWWRNPGFQRLKKKEKKKKSFFNVPPSPVRVLSCLFVFLYSTVNFP